MAGSYSETRSLLTRLACVPKRYLGQNFLIQANVAQYSVAESLIRPKEIVVEVGCGCGMLTQALVQAQAVVFGIEKDPALAAYIAQNFPIDLLRGDAVRYPVGNFDLSQPYKIVSNLPYTIASVWLGAILTLPRLPESLTLMVQKEAADRWLASENCKQFCPLGIRLQSAYRLKQSCAISSRCFYPQPKVDSTLLFLHKKEGCFVFPPPLIALMRALFMHRRQSIIHICKRIRSELSLAFLDFLEPKFHTLRAESIPVDRWIAFAHSEGGEAVRKNYTLTPKG